MQNHDENKDEKIPGMQLNINAIQKPSNIPECMQLHDLQHAITQDEHLQHLKAHIIQGLWEQRLNTTGHENEWNILRWHCSD